MSEALDALASPGGALHALALFALVAAHFAAEPARWRLYLAGEGAGGFPRLFNIFALTAFIGYTMPLKMGLPARVLLLRSQAALDLSRISSLLVLDGLLYYLCWGLAACATLLAFGAHVDLAPAMRAALVLGVALLGIGLAAWILWLRRPGRDGDGGVGGRIRDRVEGFRVAARATGARGIWSGVAVAALDVVGHAARHWALLGVFGVALDPGAIAMVASVSVFAGLASLMPMGLGGYDVTLVLLLSRLGVPAEIGVSVAVLNRVATIAVGCMLGIAGGFALGLDPLRRRWLRGSGVPPPD